MNTLFILRCPLGDTIIFSCLLKDYKEMFPTETLYVAHPTPSVLDIFKTSSIVNIHDENIKYNKVFDYDLAKFDSSEFSKIKNTLIESKQLMLQDTPYFYFNMVFKIKIPHNTYIPCIELDEEQKQKISSDKPLCLINPVANFYMFDCRYFGRQKYQQIVNDFKDKINFVSIGSCPQPILNAVTLQNVYMDLINKTSIYQLIKWIYNCDIVITHESGIYHISNIISDKQRDIIALFGARYTKEINSYSTPNINLHCIGSSDNNLYKECCFKNNQTICLKQMLVTEINGISIGKNICKAPVFLNGELLSHCMSHISVESIENEINKILNR